MQLNLLPLQTMATIAQVQFINQDDPIANRLIKLGFTVDEPIKIIAQLGKKSGAIIVKLGNSKFALRHNEAQRILVNT